jgi:hypothetical protein
MKARRDVLEHHGGIVDASYEDKAGGAAKLRPGDKIDLVEQDVDGAFTLTRDLISYAADRCLSQVESGG